MEREVAKKKEKHSCFEWIQLLISILIPVAIGIYTVIENNRELAIAKENRMQDLAIPDYEQKDRVLHECQKVITKLIERYGPSLNESNSASLVARFAALSALNQLDSYRRSFLIRLLYESQLITYHNVTHRVPMSLESANLTDLDLRDPTQQRPLLYLNLAECILVRANFYAMTLYGAKFTGSILINAKFDDSTNVLHFDPLSLEDQLNMTPELMFRSTNLENASFVNAVYHNASFTDAMMRHARFITFFCQNCNFWLVDMIFSNFDGASIEKSSLDFSRMSDASLSQATFGPNVEFFQAILDRINALHSKFETCQFNQARMQNATFDHTAITNSTFLNAKMSGISIRYSTMKNCDFTNADLRFSNWLGTICEDCIFNEADLTDASLSGAKFIRSVFRNSSVTIVQLRSTTMLDSVITSDGTSIDHP